MSAQLEAFDPVAVHLGYVGDPEPICRWRVDPKIVHDVAEVTCKLCITRYSEQIEAEREPERCTYDWPGMEGPVECGGLLVPGTDHCERHAPFLAKMREA